MLARLCGFRGYVVDDASVWPEEQNRHLPVRESIPLYADCPRAMSVGAPGFVLEAFEFRSLRLGGVRLLRGYRDVSQICVDLFEISARSD